MTTRADHLPTALRTTRGAELSRETAANDDLNLLERAAPGSAPSGWDPYEIWATRVRDPRGAPKGG